MDKHVPLYKIKDFDGFTSLTISLGSACNMHCRHCFQTPYHRPVVSSSISLSSKLNSLIHHFLAYHISHKTGVGKSDDEKPKIMFWGGEPLLYWSFIKSVIVSLYEAFGDLESCGILFSMVSNGLLLTEDIVDFLNRYHIRFSFSYDAPYPFAIRGFVSDDVCRLVNMIDHAEILCTCFSKYNCDPLLSYHCLKAKFPDVAVIAVNPRILSTFEMPSDIMDYDWAVVSQNFKKLRIAAQLGDKFALHLFKKYFIMLNTSVSDKPASSVLDCARTFHGISVSLDDKVSFCANFDEFECTLDDSYSHVQQYADAYAKSMESTECSSCVHTDICHKHCMLDRKNSAGGFFTCSQFWWRYYAIVKHEMKQLVLKPTASDISWYHSQLKLMEKEIRSFLSRGSEHC